MKLKKGDKVRILSGKDRGKNGKVLKVLPKEGKIIVEGINILTRHARPRKAGEKGQKIQFPAAFPASKAMLICPKCGQAARVGFKFEVGADRSVLEAEGKALRGEKKFRFCKKCKEIII